MNKVIRIILFYTILLLSATNLSADQKFLDKGNGHDNGNGYGRNYRQNGNGYGHGYGAGNGLLDRLGFGHGYDIGNGPGNGYGFGHTGSLPGTNAPEPISSALFILGGAGLALYKKFKNKD